MVYFDVEIKNCILFKSTAELDKIKEVGNNIQKVAMEIANVAQNLSDQPEKEFKTKIIVLRQILDQLIMLL